MSNEGLHTRPRGASRRRYDLDYRPESYWDTDGLITGLWANIKGDARRAVVKALVSSGNLDQLNLEDLADSLSDEQRRAAGALHPSLMGGEYLPDYLPGEVEIARISMDSITRDVIAIRAMPVGRRIYYRAVDEYQRDIRLERTWSLKPLTLRGLIRLVDRANYASECRGLVIGFLDFSADCHGEAEPYRDFLTIDSELYPELGGWYDERVEEWYWRWKRRRSE